MKTTHQALLPGKSIGVITRIFARAEEDVEHRVSMTMNLLTKIFTLDIAHRAQVLVPMNPAFADCDCGSTRGALIKALLGKPWAKKVAVTTSKRDDPQGTLLNYGTARLSTDWIWVVAPETIGILENRDTLAEVSAAAKADAVAIGFKFPDLAEATEAGIISNRCAFWQRIPLMEAGGFLSMSDFTLIRRAKELFDDRDISGAEEGLTVLRMHHTNPGIRTAILGQGGESRSPTEQSARDRLAKLAASKVRRCSTMVDALGGNMSWLRSSLIGV